MIRPRVLPLLAGLICLSTGRAIAEGSVVEPPVAGSILAPELSLDDLGISSTQLEANPQLQAQLERRTWMLKTHQILGLATAVPMFLALATGPEEGEGGPQGAGGSSLPSRASVRRHMVLGISTTALYLTTASFALLAPNPEHPRPRGASRIHRWLAWIHAPLMVLTPTLGLLADARLKEGKPAGSLGNAHVAAMTGLLISYGAAATIMVVNF